MGKAAGKKKDITEIIPPWIRVHWTSAVLGNVLIFGVMISTMVVMAVNREVFYVNVQEDKAIEWMSFWAFFAAAFIYAWAGVLQYRRNGKIPWFLMGVGLFCLLVALEEISWGQRLFGYRPPAYFLENNFQQEFNVHNVLDSKLRILSLKIVILGFGVIFPLVWLIPGLRRFLWKMAVVPPPLFFCPAFLATYILDEAYPWRFSGEVVELMLGLGFVASALGFAEFFKDPVKSRRDFSALRMGGVVMVLALLTALMTFVSSRQLRHQAELVAVAEKEVAALGKDFWKAIQDSPSRVTHCRLHNRVFAHVEKYGINSMYEGEFWNLTKQGLPEERARFFIDPWNTAYWVWQICDEKEKKTRIFVYSFGPNRQRDSIPWELKSDDVGVCIYEYGF